MWNELLGLWHSIALNKSKQNKVQALSLVGFVFVVFRSFFHLPSSAFLLKKLGCCCRLHPTLSFSCLLLVLLAPPPLVWPAVLSLIVVFTALQPAVRSPFVSETSNCVVPAHCVGPRVPPLLKGKKNSPRCHHLYRKTRCSLPTYKHPTLYS